MIAREKRLNVRFIATPFQNEYLSIFRDLEGIWTTFQ
jgi:hypothetical protein